MKVFILSHSSAVENLGGAELSLLHLIDAWAKDDSEVTFSVAARGPVGLLQPELAARDVTTHTLDFDAWVLPLVRTDPADILDTDRRNSEAVLAIVGLLRLETPDVVITNTIISPWAALAARYLGIPHVWFVHEFGDLDHGLQFEISRASTFEDIGILSDLVVANSRAVHEHIGQWIPADKLAIAYPVIDLDRARDLAGQEPLYPIVPDAAAELTVVMVGRLAPSKGQWRLLDALAELRDEGTSIAAILVGGDQGVVADDVKNRIRALNLSGQVVLTGETDNPFWYIERGDVGITASTSEAFGRVTVEYMALGKPVIAGHGGAGAELVRDGVTGLLFDADSPDDLVRALRHAVDHRNDLPGMGESARRSVAEISSAYPLNTVVERIEQLVARGAGPMARLPNALNLWLDLPSAVEGTGRALHDRNSAVLGSASWRLGTYALAPARLLKRTARRLVRRARRK
ncbi:glycosyltransferase family 4 protein [Cryobacterium sp. Hh38]|uniref:glycosyltransferase family 4 protein n=1 Tax=Cryobacterium sp. Hh38 TaxID=1259156 RepID=UPI00141A8A93|nr:glycosyltransferase family 4 protein [Cryobacterium sp. Hh38]